MLSSLSRTEGQKPNEREEADYELSFNSAYPLLHSAREAFSDEKRTL